MADPNYTSEEWRTIPFAPDYEASNLGNIRRVALCPPQFHMRHLKPKSNNGYPEVVLKVDGVPLFIRVHQVVCRVFHGDRPTGKDEVGHIDGNRRNARADNLRWVTKEENYADRNLHGTHNKGARNGAAKLDPLKLQAIHILSERMPSRMVAEVLGISKSQVGNILRGEAWTGGNEKRRQRRAQAKLKAA
jgi:hypothetical protein